jgi:hypothetical protein
VRLYDAARDRQSHSGSFGFCREEWLEKLLADAAGEARARIMHPDKNVSLSIMARTNDKGPRIGWQSGHCFECVDGKIEKNLQELHRISPNLARVGINFDRNSNLPSNGLAVDNPEKIVNYVVDLD